MIVVISFFFVLVEVDISPAIVEVWDGREPDFHLVLFANGYFLGCSCKQTHYSICVAASEVFSLLSGVRKKQIIQSRWFV